MEEAVGVLTELVDEEDVLLVKIGRITLALPIDMADTLRPHVGQRTAILRVDDRARPYRFRIVGKIRPPVLGTPTKATRTARQTTERPSDLNGYYSSNYI